MTVARAGRWAAWSGFLFVASWLVGLGIAPSSPDPTAPAAAVAQYYLAHRGAAMLASYLFDGVAGLSLLLFAATLQSALRSSDATLPGLIQGAGAAAAGVSFVQAAFGEALANRVAATGDAATIRALFDLINAADAFKMLPLALLIGAAAALALGTGVLPRWLGWLGAVLAPGLVVGGAGFVLNSAVLYSAMFVLLPALLVWVAAVAVVMWRWGRPQAQAAARP